VTNLYGRYASISSSSKADGAGNTALEGDVSIGISGEA